MYSNKENVNILTALLIKHGVKHAVLCPGNRNVPIIHNLVECGQIKCYPVTDERSAGFFALGVRQATKEKVAVCVTSGSSLLNLAPAVAEASMQNQGLIVISADRPQQWIGQLEGQTLPQPEALASLVTKHVTLPEPHNDEERWYCNRLVNEALLEAERPSCPSVHINVPISEPLFTFDTPELPDVHKISELYALNNSDALQADFLNKLSDAKRPMVVIGQMPYTDGLDSVDDAVEIIKENITVLCEPLSVQHPVSFDDTLARLMDSGTDLSSYNPDFVIHIGGNIVSKRLRQFLRQTKDMDVWRIGTEHDIADTFMHINTFIESDPCQSLRSLIRALNDKGTLSSESVKFHQLWTEELGKDRIRIIDSQPPYSPEAVVKYFEEQLDDLEEDIYVHYANSTAVRLGCRYADHYVWCNRGVNGIDGCLSTAVGFAASKKQKTVCVTGDLAFFYDQNALWNQNLDGNLRIILLNNHGGDIFNNFEGAKQSPAFDRFIRAAHNTEARGICTQNDVGYLSAHNMEEMYMGIVSLLTTETSRPMLLECFF